MEECDEEFEVPPICISFIITFIIVIMMLNRMLDTVVRGIMGMLRVLEFTPLNVKHVLSKAHAKDRMKFGCSRGSNSKLKKLLQLLSDVISAI